MSIEKDTYPIGAIVEDRGERAIWFALTIISHSTNGLSETTPDETPVNPISKEQLPLPLNGVVETETATVFEYADHP